MRLMLVLGAVLLSALCANPANAADNERAQCLNDARTEQQSCIKACRENFKNTRDACTGTNSDCRLACVTTYKACLDPIEDSLTQCKQSCEGSLAAARLSCATQVNCGGRGNSCFTNRAYRDCIRPTLVGLYSCRRECADKLLTDPSIIAQRTACLNAFKGCKQGCATAQPSPSPAGL